MPEIAKVEEHLEGSFLVDGLADFNYENLLKVIDRVDVLEKENQMLKDELCVRGNTYSWCKGIVVKWQLR